MDCPSSREAMDLKQLKYFISHCRFREHDEGFRIA